MGQFGHGANMNSDSEVAKYKLEKLENQVKEPMPKFSGWYFLSSSYDLYFRNGGSPTLRSKHKDNLQTLKDQKVPGIEGQPAYEEGKNKLDNEFFPYLKEILKPLNLNDDEIKKLQPKIINDKPIDVAMINLSETTGLYVSLSRIAGEITTKHMEEIDKMDGNEMHAFIYSKAITESAFSVIKESFNKAGIPAQISYDADYSILGKDKDKTQPLNYYLYVTDEKDYQKFFDHAVNTGLITKEELAADPITKKYSEKHQSDTVWQDKEVLTRKMLSEGTNHLVDAEGKKLSLEVQ